MVFNFVVVNFWYVYISGGKKKGFGFVQFSRLEEAAAALKEMNTKPIKG